MLSEFQKLNCIEGLIASGLPIDQAEITVDLADRAARAARETFLSTLRPAPNLAVGKAATQIASQLAAKSFLALAELSLSERFAGSGPLREVHLDEQTAAQAPAQEAAQ
ncbi:MULTISPECIES: hypothetical protein [unclassified Novosphingobium]|uniref:hypothetical protein n=1 Tax=unclassified Novosphingobium TaxID=2644732 RepID=UPI000868AC91|nr:MULTISPECIES: hypothetical protein [unclassified Novosphingobium]MBN9143728.1 hypothetical protein [Novosphingobium sp.]ODU84340.1 MAG: hypothetical protein ABT10_02860 [Novosphingobium sp. SCN 63-17]OJX92880.1 MAG: hypothetical protein BGP00_23460 [Novosphingobium sp. 63-713]